MQVSEIDRLANEVAQLRIQKEEIDKKLKETNKLYADAELRLIEAMTQEGKDKWNVDGVGSLSLRVSTYWSITDNQMLVEWLKKNSPEMIKIHPATIRGFANEMQKIDIDNGDLIDYEEKLGIKPYNKMGITLRKG